ncbi:MAG: metallophosphoesterase [Magnetococcales bacterium]|nr:metallophosphoesterase [Magnetococcales bacterium]
MSIWRVDLGPILLAVVLLGGCLADEKRQGVPVETSAPVSALPGGVRVLHREEAGEFRFVAYGDTREPAPNLQEELLARIVAEEVPFVFHTGDIVSSAGEHSWKIFDLFHGPLMQSKALFFPVLGNHDYVHLSTDPADNRMEPYFRRFPQVQGNYWYSVRQGPALFLMMDTNQDYRRGSPQYGWLERELHQVGSARFVVVICHVPVISSYSPILHPLRNAHPDLKALFARVRQPDLVLSGHNHGYERFEEKGTQYITTAGGGSPLYSKMEKPFFNYVRVNVGSAVMAVETIGFLPDKKQWEIIDRVDLPGRQVSPERN